MIDPTTVDFNKLATSKIEISQTAKPIDNLTYALIAIGLVSIFIGINMLTNPEYFGQKKRKQ
jgi:hypothetical protein